MKRRLALAVAALSIAGCSSDSTAPVNASQLAYFPGNKQNVSSYLIDTGPGGINGASNVISWFLESTGITGCAPQPSCSSDFQFLAGRFVLTSNAAIDSVAGWMTNANAGNIDIHIRADNAGLPGIDVFAKNYSVGVQPTGWQVFRGVNATLPAGTYWLTFEPTAGSQYFGSMEDGAPNPLSYAFESKTTTGWSSFSTSIGLRVAGSYVDASTPSDKIDDLIGLISGLGLPGGTMTAADAKLQAALNAIAANNTALACSSLQDEINFVTAQSGKKIAASDAAAILSSVAAIRAQLGC